MNAKFKMPKFGQHLTGGSMMKEIFMTFIGTTISIILTFGTAHWLETRQKKAAGRQTAMMVILDIDECVKEMRDLAKSEEESYNLACFVKENIEQIDSFSIDTLYTTFLYFQKGTSILFDESREKIFHSSQDSWKNIDNAMFIDLVQQFYHSRHANLEYMNINHVFQEPISQEKYYEYLLSAPNHELGIILKDLLRQLLFEPEFTLYMTYSSWRRSQYISLADEWKTISNRCKFLMGITNEELQEFADEQEHTGRLVKERDLIGSWISDTSEDNHDEITFRRNGTMTHKVIKRYAYSIFSGRFVVTTVMEGTWTIEGDSLIRIYPNSGCHIEIDDSQLSYTPENKENVEDFLERYQAMCIEYNEQNRNDTAVFRRTNAAYIDDSEKMVELSSIQTDDDGEPVNFRSYMVRK